MDYTGDNTQIGFRTINVVVPAGGRKQVDAHFSTIRAIAADGATTLWLEGNALPFDKGIGYAYAFVPGKGQPFSRSFELQNDNVTQVTYAIVCGVGEIADGRMNFVAGASVLDVNIFSDKVRKSIRPLNVGTTGELVLAAGTTSLLIAADDWRGQVTISNQGAVPVKLRHDNAGTTGLLLEGGDTVQLKAAHAIYAVNSSATLGALLSYVASSETVIP